MSQFTIMGLDLSLNHAGMCILDQDAKMVRFDYVTDRKKALSSGRGSLLPKFTSDDRAQNNLDRLREWRSWFKEAMHKNKPAYVTIEDYAFAAKSNSTYQIGELGGLARMIAADCGAKLRFHEPQAVKMFATCNGAATSAEVHVGAKARWGVDFSPVSDQQAIEDMGVAYTLARLVWTEVLVRETCAIPPELEEKQRQVFNRVTKANPVNLLGRDFVEARR